MFKIYDGRSHFYQWDTDRKLIVEDASISEVHFCNQTDSYSLVCKTYIEDGLNLVNVPNILLQNDWRINVYAYDSNYTKFSEQFDVIRRCKPEDYVYTETEILNYNTLSDRITKIEEGGAGLAPLVGTTQTITPSQVLAAIKEGRDIALQYTDSYYGTFVFSAFNANEKLGIVVSNSILPQWDGLTGTLIGFVDDAGWVFKATNTATKDDVGTAVNEALAAAKASGEFDGITPTIGNNGNWFLGDTDTGKPSRGADGKSAYSYAVDGGYTGTEAEFVAKLAAEKLPNPYPLAFTGAVNETYDGSSAKTIEIPSGGGGEKEWTVLVDQELSAETPGFFSITGLNNFTEFYAEWDALQHGTDNSTNSGMYFNINGARISLSPSFCPVYAPSNTPRYGWTMAKYNGLRWLFVKSDGAISKEKTSIASNMITQYYPSDITAPATEVYVGNESTYAPVSGHFKLWGR